MLSEPTITGLSIERLVLLESSGRPSHDVDEIAAERPEAVFLQSRSPLSVSLWLLESETHRIDRVMTGPSVEGTVRTARDLAGVVIGIDRLDRWPELPSRIVEGFVSAGAHIVAMQSTVSDLRVVTNGLFTRSRDVAALTRAACYRSV